MQLRLPLEEVGVYVCVFKRARPSCLSISLPLIPSDKQKEISHGVWGHEQAATVKRHLCHPQDPCLWLLGQKPPGLPQLHILRKTDPSSCS